MKDWTRQPVVSGTFYPGEKEVLRSTLESFLGPRSESPKKVIAVVAPHAGYVYSGKIAGQVYSRIEPPQRAVILCPNHTGRGKRISIWAQGSWMTPLGEANVDEPFAAALMEAALVTAPDQEAHLYEHAIEVQIPFLQSLNPGVKIVPVVLGRLTWEECRDFGRALSQVIQSFADIPTLIVASTDMSHYISQEAAQKKDTLALKEIENLAPQRLYETVTRNDISMCGFIPTTCALQAALFIGASRGEVLSYGSSGDTTRDYRSVVGYASAWVF